MSATLAKQHRKRSSGTVVAHEKGAERSVRKTGGGVVQAWVRGPTGTVAVPDLTPTKLIEVLRAGLPVEELDALQASLEVPLDRLSAMLGISKATLHRRKMAGRLGPGESERVVRYARLMGKAIEVLESDTHARQWLMSPQVGLGGAVPLHYAETEVGAREVEDLLGRIEHGVYS